MVAKKPAARKSAPLKVRPEIAAPPEFVLTDFRVVKTTAERYLPNEIAAKGFYELSTTLGDIIVPSEGEAPFGLVTYTVTLAGSKQTDAAEGSVSEKSFLVEIELEGKFNVYDCGSPSRDDVKALLPPVIQQLRVIAVDKMRSAVSDMGYHGVRPALGARNVRADIGESEPLTAEAAAKLSNALREAPP
jgi:hypothetical protein